jgi:tricorn protease
VDGVASRRRTIHNQTDGRVGYCHIPDCERLGFAEFHRHFVQESRRAALVIDIRGNAGGHISELLL